MTATTEISSKYATPLELARYLNIEEQIPSLEATGSARAKEEVGTGNNSDTLFYLDNAYVINGSYSLFFGATESAAVALNEGSNGDYTLNLSNGTITLTAAGVTKVGVNNIYASYSNMSKMKLTNQQLQESLDRADSEIDTRTSNHFAVGTAVTPDWKQRSEEKQRGKGYYNRDYFTERLPLPNIDTRLRKSVSTAATSIEVDSTNGFPVAGYLGVERDKIEYTGKSGSAFTGATAVTMSHSTAVTVRPFVVEASTTESGTSPSWEILEYDEDFDLDLQAGRVHLYVDNLSVLTIDDANSPPNLVPNRFRTTYLQGEAEIPKDIRRAALMIASRDLMHMAVRKATMNGNDNFQPRMIEVDENWITETLNQYTNWGINNP